eukprot:4257185-Prymnesium_polylepis.1
MATREPKLVTRGAHFALTSRSEGASAPPPDTTRPLFMWMSTVRGASGRSCACAMRAAGRAVRVSAGLTSSLTYVRDKAEAGDWDTCARTDATMRRVAFVWHEEWLAVARGAGGSRAHMGEARVADAGAAMHGTATRANREGRQHA